MLFPSEQEMNSIWSIVLLSQFSNNFYRGLCWDEGPSNLRERHGQEKPEVRARRMVHGVRCDEDGGKSIEKAEISKDR